MNDFRYIKYEATPKEKHVGIMTVEIRGVLLRYKIIKTKDGNSLFPAAASYKMSGEDEDARYLSAFALDSNSEQEMLFDFIKGKMVEILSRDHQKSNTINDREKNASTQGSALKSSNISSNAEIDTSDDLPF